MYKCVNVSCPRLFHHRSLTSYFCLFSLSMCSNFSASRVFMNSNSSCALSLKSTRHTLARLDCLHGHFNSLEHNSPQFVLVEMVNVEWFASLSQDLFLLLSLCLFLATFLGIGLKDKQYVGFQSQLFHTLQLILSV